MYTTVEDVTHVNGGEQKLLEIEEIYILKRWSSPSFIDAINFPNLVRMIIFCSAVFFKFRAVNKKM
jgi:hypothetical protein